MGMVLLGHLVGKFYAIDKGSSACLALFACHVKIAQYIQEFVSSKLRLKKAGIKESDDPNDEEFFDAQEPMESQAIFQVVSVTQLPRGRTENFPLVKESRIKNFRVEEVTHPHYWKSNLKGQSFGKKENAPDFVYVMNGKWNETTARDCRLYRFTVLDGHIQPLWNHLNTVTCIAPENFIRLWIETLSEREQEDTVVETMKSIPDSGCPTENFMTPEYALKVSNEGKWECERANRKFSYVYLLMLKTHSLKQLTLKKPPLGLEQNHSFYIMRLQRLAEYIQSLHGRNIVHGNITMRNVYFLEEGWNMQVFIASECFYFAQEEIVGDSDDARKRRKFFDAEQRTHPVNVDMACDVFAFGLIIVELLGGLVTDQKNAITRNIRSHTVMNVLNTFRCFEPCKCIFGRLLEQIFLPRQQRIKIGEVVKHMNVIAANVQTR